MKPTEDQEQEQKVEHLKPLVAQQKSSWQWWNQLVVVDIVVCPDLVPANLALERIMESLVPPAQMVLGRLYLLDLPYLRAEHSIPSYLLGFLPKRVRLRVDQCVYLL